MGSAVNWQEHVIKSLSTYSDALQVCNPRRDDWDSSWVQDISNDKFREQVRWELRQIEQSDLIIFYFDPDGQALITLLELGLVATDDEKNIIVCCPPGYFRRGNVQVVCDQYFIPFYDSIEDMLDKVHLVIQEKNIT